jgi:hypothetical protein
MISRRRMAHGRHRIAAPWCPARSDGSGLNHISGSRGGIAATVPGECVAILNPEGVAARF